MSFSHSTSVPWIQNSKPQKPQSLEFSSEAVHKGGHNIEKDSPPKKGEVIFKMPHDGYNCSSVCLIFKNQNFHWNLNFNAIDISDGINKGFCTLVQRVFYNQLIRDKDFSTRQY